MKCVQRINKVKQIFGNKMISILASIMMIIFSVFYNLLALTVDMRQPIGRLHSFKP